MKIRSLLELNDIISRELSWRKKELITLSILVKKRREHERVALLRASIPILYAHWEGFIKNTASYYLQYVSRKKLKYSDLQSNFIALACKSALQESLQSNKILLLRQVVDFLMCNQQEVSKIPYDNVIDTGSNLNSEVFINILHQIGLSYDSFYLTKELAIDGALLKKRNAIAHGEKLDVTEEEFSELSQLVVELLEYFRNHVENAAATEGFKGTIR